MRIQVNKGKIEDALIVFGKEYNEIEEVEEFMDDCECSMFELEVSPELEQNQIKFYVVDRKKDSKKGKKKTASTLAKNKDTDAEEILHRYGLNILRLSENTEDDINEGSKRNSSKYGEISNKFLKLNAFYFNRQMFNMFASLEEITAFILPKKDPNCKNLLVLEDVKDIFVAKHIRNAIQMT